MIKTQLNINNLHALWKEAGIPFNGYSEKGKMYQSKITGSEWPNKIWTLPDVCDDSIERIKVQMKTDSSLTFSHFSSHVSVTNELVKQGFHQKSVQYGMSLELKNNFKPSKELQLKKAETVNEISLWCKAFKQAFNYSISEPTLEKTKNTIPYFLVYDNKDLVGTIILYITGNTAGVHSLGIIPEMRKKGYATEIMYRVLNRSIKENAKTATLQASEMAKNMYLGMGFSTDFIMHNYQLKP